MNSGLLKQGTLIVVFLTTTMISTQSFATSSVISLENQTRYTTWQGIEPDKWATAWLIKRHISRDAYFLLVPPNTAFPDNAVPFGVPDADIRRANRQSMFRRLKQQMELEGEALDYLDTIIHDTEVNIWDAPIHPHSLWFETLYRQLQARYQRDQVPVDCYLAFFDAVARLAKQQNITAEDYRDQLDLKVQCPGLTQRSTEFVAQLSHIDVLREMSLGKRMMFVDTREDDEFNEVHLPGATILRLRDVNAKRVKTFEEADWVVPYCVKDFRGFEVAKAIRQLGVSRVATLSPNGLKGWLAAKLPVVKEGETFDGRAMERLMRCAMEPGKCLDSSGNAPVSGRAQ